MDRPRAIPQKFETGWVVDMKFPGILKKEHVEIPRVNFKKVAFLVFDLGIFKGCHKILQNFRGEACFLWNF